MADDRFDDDTPPELDLGDDIADAVADDVPPEVQPVAPDWVDHGEPWTGDPVGSLGDDPIVGIGSEADDAHLEPEVVPPTSVGGQPAVSLPLDAAPGEISGAAQLLPLDEQGAPVAGPPIDGDPPPHEGFRLGDPLADVLAADAGEGVLLPDALDAATAFAELGDPDDLELDFDDDHDPLAPIEFQDAERDMFAELADENGRWPALLVAAAVAAATGTALHALTTRLSRAPNGLDATAAAGLADSLGVDAFVEHGNIERLRSSLADGETVLLERGNHSGPLALVACEAERIVVEPVAGGERKAAPISTLRAAWADSAGQFVSIDSGERRVLVLPVVLPEASLSSVPP